MVRGDVTDHYDRAITNHPQAYTGLHLRDGNGPDTTRRVTHAHGRFIRQTASVATIGTTLHRIEIDGVGHGSVGTLVIDNPERRNAMTAAMYLAIPDAVTTLVDEPDLRCVILKGAGDLAFSAGSDISEFADRRMGRRATEYDNAEHRAWEAIASIAVPVIAAIHGPCRGGGVAIALHADLRIAADDATFSVPPATLGIAYPSQATERLMALVGPAVAKQMLYTAQVLDAREALRVGLVQETHPPQRLDEHVASIARRIARLAPLSIKAAKQTIDTIVTKGHADAHDAVDACYHSEDFAEGVLAFMEKRRPHFHGY